jgi:hypothetical protein
MRLLARKHFQGAGGRIFPTDGRGQLRNRLSGISCRLRSISGMGKRIWSLLRTCEKKFVEAKAL